MATLMDIKNPKKTPKKFNKKYNVKAVI